MHKEYDVDNSEQFKIYILYQQLQPTKSNLGIFGWCNILLTLSTRVMFLRSKTPICFRSVRSSKLAKNFISFTKLDEVMWNIFIAILAQTFVVVIIVYKFFKQSTKNTFYYILKEVIKNIINNKNQWDAFEKNTINWRKKWKT